MAKRHKNKRSYKIINFKVYHDTDSDILDWWDGIESGERSDAMRDLIREQLGVGRVKRKSPIIDLPELMEVRRDTIWIRDALNDMPAYLERVIQEVTANIQPIAVGQYQARASPTTQSNDPSLTDAETQRRTRKLKKATW